MYPLTRPQQRLPSWLRSDWFGETIFAWEKVRPTGMKTARSAKTGEIVDFLSLSSSSQSGVTVLINDGFFIPRCVSGGLVCRGQTRAGTSPAIADARRLPRSSLTPAVVDDAVELQQWLCHCYSPAATQHYAKITSNKIGYAIADTAAQ